MSLFTFREFPTGDAAMFIEPSSDGAIDDFDAPRNAPVKLPELHLGGLLWHSRLDMLALALEASVTINHGAVSAAAGIGGNAAQSQVFQWGGHTADHLLLDISALGLTREPLVAVSVAGSILTPGQPVQTDAAGKGRYATIYSTPTQVRLAEEASRAGTSLAAQSITYLVWVLLDPAAQIGNILKQFDPETGELQLGFGRFASLRRYLQVAPGGSPLALIKDRSIDLANGAPRFVRAAQSPYEPVPSTLTVRVNPGTGAFGSPIAYTGSYAGTGFVEVQAP